jgi:hypothetical protein
VLNLVDFDQHFAVSDDNHGQDIMCMSNEGLVVMSMKHHHVWTSGSAPAFPELRDYCVVNMTDTWPLVQ